eukprot:786700-Pelagomonas_calceolata.AAC.3
MGLQSGQERKGDHQRRSEVERFTAGQALPMASAQQKRTAKDGFTVQYIIAFLFGMSKAQSEAFFTLPVPWTLVHGHMPRIARLRCVCDAV